jgi:hypothetical protein
MKTFILSLSIIILLLTVSCKKDITKEKNHFLRGQLFDDCGGTPIPNQKIYLWKNFKEGNFLVADQPEKLLDSAITNTDGYFYFIGDKSYLSKNDLALSNTSLRLSNNQYLANGVLGENPKAKKNQTDEISNKDVGKLYLNGIKTDIILNISANNGGGNYDSVRVVSSSNVGVFTISNPINNYFIDTLFNVQLNPKYISSTEFEDHLKYYYWVKLYFYSNGYSSSVYNSYIFVNECSATNTLTFNF